MRFQDMPYRRVTYEELERRYQELTRDIETAKDGAACLEVLRQRGWLSDDMTPMELCCIRHDMDVNDPFYAAEQEYYDEIDPKVAELSNRFEQALLNSPHRGELEQALGLQAMTMMEQAQQSFDSLLIPLAQEENALLSRHNKLVSNAAVDWDGGKVKRSLMTPFLQSADRETRRRASLAVSDSWGGTAGGAGGDLQPLGGQPHQAGGYAWPFRLHGAELPQDEPHWLRLVGCAALPGAGKAVHRPAPHSAGGAPAQAPGIGEAVFLR